MPKHDLPDPAYLHQRLRYEPETGKLFWRHYAPFRPQWNGKHAGTEAFIVAHDGGYLKGTIDHQKLFKHRVIWAMHHGFWPEGMLDHHNKDRADCRIGNLRLSNNVHNARNMHRSRANTSGATGVRWHDRLQKWHAQIMVRGQCKYLGVFETFDDAVAARKAAEAEHDFDPNHGAPRP